MPFRTNRLRRIDRAPTGPEEAIRQQFNISGATCGYARPGHSREAARGPTGPRDGAVYAVYTVPPDRERREAGSEEEGARGLGDNGDPSLIESAGACSLTHGAGCR